MLVLQQLDWVHFFFSSFYGLRNFTSPLGVYECVTSAQNKIVKQTKWKRRKYKLCFLAQNVAALHEQMNIYALATIETGNKAQNVQTLDNREAE